MSHGPQSSKVSYDRIYFRFTLELTRRSGSRIGEGDMESKGQNRGNKGCRASGVHCKGLCLDSATLLHVKSENRKKKMTLETYLKT